MNQFLKIILLVFFFNVQLTGIQAQTLKIGDTAPPMQVAGWLRNKPEAPLKKGEVHIVEFWATWCQPCLAGIPHLNEIAAKYAGQGLNVYGISIMERKNVDIDSLRRFMETSIGKSMEYHVATDGAANFMKANWVEAVGQRGIPFAIVVNGDGRIAWYGHPNALDGVLPDILTGNWNLDAKRKSFEDQTRLKNLDANEVVNLLNPYMIKKDHAGGLIVLDSLLEKEPDLLYYSRFGHFMAYCLIGTQSKKATSYIRSWWDAGSEPGWKSVSDAIYSFSRVKPEVLTPELYLLGAEALQAQLENYPWSMNFKTTYEEMAEYYKKAGKVDMAKELEQKAANLDK